MPRGTAAAGGNEPTRSLYLTLIEWVNRQPLNTPITCLGDGHDGVWKIIAAIATAEQRRASLD